MARVLLLRGAFPAEDDVRSVDLDLREALVRIIELHLPSSAEEVEELAGGTSMQTKRSLSWASALMDANTQAEAAFGASKDVERLRTAEHSARALLRELKSLSRSTRYTIDSRASDWRKSTGRSATSLLKTIKTDLPYLVEALAATRQHRDYRTIASKRRDWRAASAAGACRMVWAAAHWSGPKWLDCSPEQLAALRTHMRDFAPQSEKHDLPGPFGRFVTEVFEALGILTKNGEPVSAATALRSWRDARSKSSVDEFTDVVDFVRYC